MENSAQPEFVTAAAVPVQWLLKIYVNLENPFLMRRLFSTCLFLFLCSRLTFAQQPVVNENIKQLKFYEDSLTSLGKKFINADDELERRNANYTFIKTLVTALKIKDSYNYQFDSVKSITITNSPDKRFRMLTWHITNNDGSFRFYGTLQLNTGGELKMYPLGDFSPYIKNPQDTVTDNTKWYGCQYYTIIPINALTPYYVLLGWKGNNDKSTKKVIDVLSFKDNKPAFGMPVFDERGKMHDRIVFEYTRQVSMLLKYITTQNLIVFDHLAPPDPKLKSAPETYGPDMSYDGYRLRNGKWSYVENLDMRNVQDNQDNNYSDPKKPTVEKEN
jgi:hypothetical protein